MVCRPCAERDWQAFMHLVGTSTVVAQPGSHGFAGGYGFLIAGVRWHLKSMVSLHDVALTFDTT
eukprot:57299-Amphidinium_carterae.2